MKKLSNNRFTQQKGFTLIELVVVIVILGILAATAAPKFIDLTGDARESVMQGVQGSVNSAVNLAHAKALVEGQTGATGSITIGGTAYALVHGYPAAIDDTDDGRGIAGLIELENGTSVSITETAAPTLFQYSGVTDVTTCQISYANATSAENPPVVTATLTGC